KYNIEVEETQQTDEQKQAADARESLYLVSEYAKEYFHKTLLNSQLGKAIGLTYFKERGFTDATIKKFQLGYSPDQWSAFTDEALRKGYQLEFLEKTGLTIVKEAENKEGEPKKFDRFKGRVMFPIQSLSGRILGFGGRILKTDKRAAKYLNSPESEIYHKSKVLYGIYFAKQNIAKEDNCYLVEGYTDVIQMHQLGIENVVASSGTALTPEQIRLINRLTPNITVLFDGDAAGQRASIRGIDLILEQGMNVKVCSFPDGEDPDSFSRKHSQEEVKTYLDENAKDFIQYKASLLVAEAGGDPIKKAALIRDMVESIAKIPDVIKREIYVQECARIMDIGEDVLFNTLAQVRNTGKKEAARESAKPREMEVVAQQPKVKVDRQYELERKLIEQLLLYGNKQATFQDVIIDEDEQGEVLEKTVINESFVFEKIYLELQSDEIEFGNNLFKNLYVKLIDKLNVEREEFKIDRFINNLEQEEAQLVSDIILNEEKYTLHRWDTKDIYVKQKKTTIDQVVTETILSLRQFYIFLKIEELAENIQKAKNSREVLMEIKDYKTLDQILAHRLQRVL
ncbi:MAG: DNA primase, partial [Leeuwenhoekiella sp.]